MKLYLKVIGYSCYTCLPQTLLAAVPTRLKNVAPGTPPVAQRLLTIVTPKHGPHMHIHANNGKSEASPIREDLKVLLYQSQEADNTLLHQMVHHRTALRGNGQ
jgi:hypothetical protein